MSAKLAVRSEPYFERSFASVRWRSGMSIPESVREDMKNMGCVMKSASMVLSFVTLLIRSFGLETVNR